MTDAAADFAKRLDRTAEETERLLAQLLSDTLLPDAIARPKRLMEAMRYSTLGGGKRLRPFLVVESSAVFGVPREAALLVGAALECIHCYSLIHDDLPAMDNSDLRRGRPTLHKKTDDATAILAGDGLLTYAFDIISRDEVHRDPMVRLLLTRALARASGQRAKAWRVVWPLSLHEGKSHFSPAAHRPAARRPRPHRNRRTRRRSGRAGLRRSHHRTPSRRP